FTDPCHCEDDRTVFTHLPTGFIGDTHAVPACALVAFALGKCPVDSQVGIFALRLNREYTPIYNIEPKPDQSGVVGINYQGFFSLFSFLELSGRTDSDYGLDSFATPIFHYIPIPELNIFLWGVPADPSHDGQRFFSPVRGNCQNFPNPCVNVT